MKKTKNKILCVNDLHIGPSTYEDFCFNWNEMLRVATSKDVEYIVVGGDVFKSRDSQTLAVLLMVKSCFEKAVNKGFKLVLADGNHDKVNQEADIGYLALYNSIDNVTVVKRYETIELEDVKLTIMPYFPENGSFKKRLKDIEVDNDYFNILYIHEGVNGALKNETKDNKELPVSIFKKYNHVIAGHYHNRACIDNVEYIGSSRQHHFGEDEEKGYTIINKDGSTEFIKNKSNIRFITIEVEYKDIDNNLYNDIDSYKENNYRVRLIINCSPEEKKLVNKKELTAMGISKVITNCEENIDKGDSLSSNVSKFDKGGLKTIYNDFATEKNIDPKFGIKYIDKIK